MLLKDNMKYDGHLLHQRFGFKYFKETVESTGNIIAFRGEMEVLADAMIDQEDVLNNAFIYSDDALNFLWEIPLLGNSPFGAVAYQRLFNTLIANTLSEKYLKKPVKMKGDDIMVLDNNQYSKASVSITHVKDHAALGHTGINIIAGDRAPDYAYSTKLSDDAVIQFAHDVIEQFYALNKDIFVATAKVI